MERPDGIRIKMQRSFKFTIILLHSYRELLNLTEAF